MDPSQVAAYAAHFHSQPPLSSPPPPQPQPLQQPKPQPQPQPPFSAAYVHPSPVPSPSSNPVPSHPSYTEMITAAILWENSQGKESGSSKRAIAKYIDRVYSNLPPTHSALLTHHLIRLKNSGQLVMIKNSYQLSSLTASQPSPTPALPLSPQQQHVQASSTPLVEQPSASTKRKPGRPPKVKQPEFETETVPQAKPESGDMGSEPLSGKKRRGRPAKVVQPFLEAEPEVASAGVSNGKVEEGSSVKRRGRPKKMQKQQEVEEMDEGVVVEQQPVFQVEVEEAPVDEVDAVKRGSGRPKKVINYNENDNDDDNDNNNNNATGLVSGNVQLVDVVKRGAGRPKKVVNYNDNDNNANGLVSYNVQSVDVVKRGAGRPKKVVNYNENENENDNNATGVVSYNVQPVDAVKRGAGRPKKVVSYNENDTDNNATGLVLDNVEKRKKRGWPAGKPRGKRVVAMALSGVRRRGRKPKGSVGMVEKKVYTGKTRGRPKKDSHRQEVASDELLGKLEDMQSKLRDAVGVLRPHVANLSAPDALIALQQLEELSTMNATSSPALTALQVMDVPADVSDPPPSTSTPPPITSVP